MDDWERRVLSQYSTPGMRALATRALGLSGEETTPTPAGAALAAMFSSSSSSSSSSSDTADGHPSSSGAANDDVAIPTSDVTTATAGGCEVHLPTPVTPARPFEASDELAGAGAGVRSNARDAGANTASPSEIREPDCLSCAASGMEKVTTCSSVPGWSTVLIGSIKAMPQSGSSELYESPMIFNQHTLSWEGGGEVDMSGFDEDEGESVGRESRLGSAMPAAARGKSTVPTSRADGLVAAAAAGGAAGAWHSSRYRLSREDRAFFAQCEREHAHTMELFMSKRYFEKLRRHSEQALRGRPQSHAVLGGGQLAP